MRIGSLLAAVWLVVGVLATAQRHYFDRTDTNCAHLGTVALTVVAGPLNYVGANPKVNCKELRLPQPSR